MAVNKIPCACVSVVADKTMWFRQIVRVCSVYVPTCSLTGGGSEEELTVEFLARLRRGRCRSSADDDRGPHTHRDTHELDDDAPTTGSNRDDQNTAQTCAQPVGRWTISQATGRASPPSLPRDTSPHGRAVCPPAGRSGGKRGIMQLQYIYRPTGAGCTTDKPRLSDSAARH